MEAFLQLIFFFPDHSCLCQECLLLEQKTIKKLPGQHLTSPTGQNDPHKPTTNQNAVFIELSPNEYIYNATPYIVG